MADPEGNSVGNCTNPLLTTYRECKTLNKWLLNACSNSKITNQPDCEAVNHWVFDVPTGEFGSCSNPILPDQYQCQEVNVWDGGSCSNPLLTTQAACDADNTWTPPSGICSDAANTDKASCVAAGQTWAKYYPEIYSLFETSSAIVSDGKLQIRLPRYMSPGRWSIFVTRLDGCQSTLEGVVDVVGELSLSLLEASPQYFYFATNTEMTIKRDSSTTSPFVVTPRLYLSPAVIPGTCTDATGAEETLEPGLAYDVLVINPNGQVGLLEKGVTVNVDPAPVISGITPPYVETSSTSDLQLRGSNFDIESSQILCYNQLDVASAPIPGTITASTASTATIRFTFPADTVVCVVQITNTDQSSFEFASIPTKKGPNIVPFGVSDFKLLQQRRGPSMVFGLPSPASRFAYVIGGDSRPGMEDAPLVANALPSVESTKLAYNFKPSQAFSEQSSQLPAGLSFGHAFAVGSYVYYLGGYNADTGSSSSKIYRAQVLNPLKTPELGVNLNLLEDAQTDLTQGLWYYRLVAVFGDQSQEEYTYYSGDNGPGQSLPGEPLSINLPDLPGMQLTLSWDAVPGADSYRLFRSVSGAPEDATNYGLVFEGSGLFYVDTGVVADTSVSFLPFGALSEWHTLQAELLQPRARFAAVYVPALEPTSKDIIDTEGCILLFGGSTSWLPADTINNEVEKVCITVTPAPASNIVEKHQVTVSVQSQVFASPAGVGAHASLITDLENNFNQKGVRQVYLGPSEGVSGANNGVLAFDIAADASIVSNKLSFNVGSQYIRRDYCMPAVGPSLWFLAGRRMGGGNNLQLNGGKTDWTGTNQLGGSISNVGSGSTSSPKGGMACVRQSAFIFLVGGAVDGGQDPGRDWESSFCCG